ncbi:hypothetical protein BC941DRAFT_424709 [Chlamydoabsidia padenii]|nr:hypothetical protein BC941DRAFT_424709 [Chlamydoabsidia padenii]
MDIDVPELTDSTAGIEYPDPEIMQQDPFNYERQTSSQDSAATKKKKRIPVIRFDKMVQVHSTYSHQDYNRHPDPDAICTRLNATLAHQIKEELNLFKTTEMPIHEQSKLYTQIFL